MELNKIRDGRTDLVFDYLEKGESPHQKDLNNVSLMQWCAYYGDVTAIKLLLSKGAELASMGINYDLNGAAFHGHWQLCQFLLEQGSDPNYADKTTGETALHNCIHANSQAGNYVLNLLLRSGANPNAKTIPNKETGSFMRDAYTKGESPLHRAAAFGNKETIQLLLNAGADKTIKDINQESPIGWASWHCRSGEILKLLAHGSHQIHPLHAERMLKDHGYGWSGGMEINLLGQIH